MYNNVFDSTKNIQCPTRNIQCPGACSPREPSYSIGFFLRTSLYTLRIWTLEIPCWILDILLVPQTYDLPRIPSKFPPFANRATFTKLQKFRKRKNLPLANRIPPLAKTGLCAGALARTFISSKQQTRIETHGKPF